MTSFSIRANAFSEIKKKLLLKTLLISAGAAAIGIWVAVANDNSSGSFNIWPYYTLFLAGLIALQTNRRLKKMKAALESYRLTISNEGVITREQLSLNSLSVSAIEISEITKYKSGMVCIKGLTKADLIYVPAQIEHPDLLEVELNKLHIVSVLTNTPTKQKLAIVLAITNIVCMLGVFISSNKVIVSLGGLMLTITTVYVFIETGRSKNVPDQVKRRRWIFLIILIAVLLNILVKVFGVNLANFI